MNSTKRPSTRQPVQIWHVKKTSPKPFEAVITSFESQLGKPSLQAIEEAVRSGSLQDIEDMQGKSQLMILGLLDMGAAVPALTNKGIRAKQYLIGNPIFADKMIRHNVEAGLYAPLRIFVYEDSHGTSFVYDQPSSLFGQWHSLEIDNVAQKLDFLLDNLIDTALAAD